MTELAREYGEGLYLLARDENLAAQIVGELRQISEILAEQPDFIRLLGSRAVNLEQRLQIVDDTFAGRAHPYVVNFMKILVRRGSMDAFRDCAKWFAGRYNDDNGIAEAHVTSAAPLDAESRAALREKLCAMTGKKVELTVKVDPALIGGIRVEIGGRRYDNSIRNRLDRLKSSLAGR